jgi:hypothetical protein
MGLKAGTTDYGERPSDATEVRAPAGVKKGQNGEEESEDVVDDEELFE